MPSLAVSLADLLLPATDAGVMVQAVVVLLGGSTAAVLLRRRPDARLLAVGLTVALVGAMTVRALH